MKEDKFNKIIHDRLYDHQMPVPDEIWNKLEAELQFIPPKKVPLFKRYRSIAAIAASVILIGGLSVYLTHQMATVRQTAVSNNQAILSPVVTPVEKITEQLTANTTIQKDQVASKSDLPVTVAANKHKKALILPAAMQREPVEAQKAASTVNKASLSQHKEEPAQSVPEEEKAAKTRAFIEDGQKARNAVSPSSATKIQKKQNDNIQLAVNFGNSGFANALQKQPYATLRTKIDKDMLQFAQDMHPHSMGSRTNVKHHTPLSFGIMISKELPYNLAVESGIRYTYMHSELKNPEETRKESQQLHYLGVPLYIKYNFWKWRNFNTYAKVGGAIDFNIAGTWKELYNYQADFGTGLVSAFNEEIEKRPQFSVAGSLGIAYSLSNLFQLYFEPGVSYYFDNYTGVRNIRKEKPLDLSLQVGGRFSF